MVGGDRLGRPARRREVSAILRDPERVAEDRAGRRGAEADENLGLDQGQLGVEPRTTSLELVRPWRLMDSALAALLELEVLDRVGDIERLALETRFGPAPCQTPPRPDRRMARPADLPDPPAVLR